jgi:hypothetical protein
MVLSHAKMTIRAARAAAVVALLVPGAAYAGEVGRFLRAPASASGPPVKLAVQYELKLRLPTGQGLARLLLDVGVERSDAAAAAKLAAGHLGDGDGGCDVEVSISRTAGSGGFALVRATLLTNAGRTVIERRGADLEIASDSPARKFPRLV